MTEDLKAVCEVNCDATYTQKSLAAALGRSESWVFEHVICEGCPHAKMGRHYFVSGRSFRAFVESLSLSRKQNDSRGKAVHDSADGVFANFNAEIALPIVHINRLAEQLSVKRDWIVRNWLNSDNPPPHFRDGDAVFFSLRLLDRWAGSRSTESPLDDIANCVDSMWSHQFWTATHTPGKPIYEAASEGQKPRHLMPGMPLIHIDDLANQLNLERRWVVDHWIRCDCVNDTHDPLPHFRDGRNVFILLENLKEWAFERTRANE